ncbi:hypothetical protein RhiLY_13379 [Ceratobasidium sp. AG-Ba]|nr:hypothetical protein RhiLY_13379 [Ceratobasidium sp. AG-Ba]
MPPSAKGARRRPRSPNKTPKKQTKLVDFTSRRSNAGSSSSPAKQSSPAKASYHHDDSSETDLATDASSDVNEVQFEKPGAPTTQRKKVIESSEEDEKKSEQEVIDLASTDDEDEKVVVRKMRKGKAKQVVEESEEEVEPVKRGGKRKVITLSLTPSSASEEERKPGRVVRRNNKVEEEESEEDIMDGLDEHVVLDSRLRSAPTRNSKMMQMRENLARLKRRKLGQDTPPVHSESGSSESEQAEEEAQIVRPRGRRVFKPIPGAQPTLQDYFENSENSDRGARSNNNPKRDGSDGGDDDGSDLDSWIEDDGGEANVPVLPEGYSMLGHQSLAHHFKVVMQFFVHLACMKAKKRKAFRVDEKNDQYFGLSLRALSRKLDGMRDSLVVSSAWTPQFKKALNS